MSTLISRSPTTTKSTNRPPACEATSIRCLRSSRFWPWAMRNGVSLIVTSVLTLISLIRHATRLRKQLSIAAGHCHRPPLVIPCRCASAPAMSAPRSAGWTEPTRRPQGARVRLRPSCAASSAAVAARRPSAIRRGTSDIVHCAIRSISGWMRTTDGSLARSAVRVTVRIIRTFSHLACSRTTMSRVAPIARVASTGTLSIIPPSARSCVTASHGREQSRHRDRRAQRHTQRSAVDDDTAPGAQVGRERGETTGEVLDERVLAEHAVHRRRSTACVSSRPQRGVSDQRAIAPQRKASAARLDRRWCRAPPHRRRRRARRSWCRRRFRDGCPRSSSTCRTPTCAAPKAPPPPRVSPRVGSSRT